MPPYTRTIPTIIVVTIISFLALFKHALAYPSNDGPSSIFDYPDPYNPEEPIPLSRYPSTPLANKPPPYNTYVEGLAILYPNFDLPGEGPIINIRFIGEFVDRNTDPLHPKSRAYNSQSLQQTNVELQMGPDWDSRPGVYLIGDLFWRTIRNDFQVFVEYRPIPWGDRKKPRRLVVGIREKDG